MNTSKSASIEQIAEEGYAMLPSFFNEKEMDRLLCILEQDFSLQVTKPFAIRNLSKQSETFAHWVQGNSKLQDLLLGLFDAPFYLSKSLYFNKFAHSNWFVAYHQDLSIAVQEKKEVAGYKQWTKKEGHYGVVPPLKISENTITLRIHLDEATNTNGVLKVLPGSHKQGHIRIDGNFDSKTYGEEVFCTAAKGAVLLMKPLVLHASNTSTSDKERKVIHLEFNTIALDTSLAWYEKLPMPITAQRPLKKDI